MVWYFEKEELLNTPSFKDGVDSETECRYRMEGVNFITDMGKNISLGYNTIATAVVFFHRFYMVHSFKEYPRYITACSCLFLAGKAEETPKRSNDLLKAAKEVFSNDDEMIKQKFDENLQEEIIKYESVLMHTINFEFEVEHPYKYLLEYAKYLKGHKAKVQNVVQMSWNFVNDSLRTTLSIQWEPEVIAISVLHLSTRLCTFEVTDWKGKTPEHKNWWDLFVEDLDKDILEDICNQVLDLYAETKPSSTFDSPLSISSNEGQINSSVSSPVESASNTFNDPGRFSTVNCWSNVVYPPGFPPVNPAMPMPVPPPMDFSVPPPNFNAMHPMVLPPNSFNIPPPSLPTFPVYAPTIDYSCFTLTPDSPLNKQLYYPLHS